MSGKNGCVEDCSEDCEKECYRDRDGDCVCLLATENGIEKVSEFFHGQSVARFC